MEILKTVGYTGRYCLNVFICGMMSMILHCLTLKKIKNKQITPCKVLILEIFFVLNTHRCQNIF